MKEFKERHGNAAAKGGLSCAAASDSSKEDSSRVATPASRKRKRTKAMKEVDDIEAEDVKDTPSKNRKVKAEPKKEEKF